MKRSGIELAWRKDSVMQSASLLAGIFLDTFHYTALSRSEMKRSGIELAWRKDGVMQSASFSLTNYVNIDKMKLIKWKK